MDLRPAPRSGGALLRIAGVLAAGMLASAAARAQEPAQGAAPSGSTSGPIAIVATDSSATVTGTLQVSAGKTLIATSGSITSADKTTEVTLPRRGVLRVCASTTVKLSADLSVPAGETPGLMMAMDHGAIEASFATAKNSDILLTPDFRILIGGPRISGPENGGPGNGGPGIGRPNAADVKVRLGQHGDTCVDNPGLNGPYVLVSSVFDGGAYRVQPGQRVMFQHGSLQEVVDQEKEPCGCPEATKPGSNEFPVAQSAGLAPLEPAVPATSPAAGQPARQPLSEPLVYQAPVAKPAPEVALPPTSNVAQPSPVPAPASGQNKPGFFHRVGRFFRRIFGAE